MTRTKEDQALLDEMYIWLKMIADKMNEDGNPVWEQPKMTCKQLDILAMDLRELLPEIEERIISE